MTSAALLLLATLAGSPLAADKAVGMRSQPLQGLKAISVLVDVRPESGVSREELTEAVRSFLVGNGLEVIPTSACGMQPKSCADLYININALRPSGEQLTAVSVEAQVFRFAKVHGADKFSFMPGWVYSNLGMYTPDRLRRGAASSAIVVLQRLMDDLATARAATLPPEPKK